MLCCRITPTFPVNNSPPHLLSTAPKFKLSLCQEETRWRPGVAARLQPHMALHGPVARRFPQPPLLPPLRALYNVGWHNQVSGTARPLFLSHSRPCWHSHHITTTSQLRQQRQFILQSEKNSYHDKKFAKITKTALFFFKKRKFKFDNYKPKNAQTTYS